MELLQQAGESGSAEAWYWLGRLTFAQDSTDPSAAEYMKRGAAEGNVAAMRMLARMYRYGRGVEQDHKRAFDLFLQLANLRDPRGSFEVSNAYRAGSVVDQEPELAETFFERALD
ncbi:MAG: hypothetical protein AAF479_17355, partial [Pseudomonadota bacterium]